VATAVARNPEDVRMTFGEHLEELRWRLFKSVLALVVAFAASIFFYKDLVKIVVRPHFRAMNLLGVTGENAQLMSGAYTGPIWAVMKLSFIVAIIVASPVIAWQIWKFISAGLYPKERKYVHYYAPVSMGLFLAGIAFGYFILVPYGLFGMAEMMKIDVITPRYMFADYLDLFMVLTVMTGLIFQLPLVMLFITSIGLATAKSWLKWIRFAVVGIFVVSALITPSPDAFTQCLMALPLFGLYLLGILLSAFVGRKAVAR